MSTVRSIYSVWSLTEKCCPFKRCSISARENEYQCSYCVNYCEPITVKLGAMHKNAEKNRLTTPHNNSFDKKNASFIQLIQYVQKQLLEQVLIHLILNFYFFDWNTPLLLGFSRANFANLAGYASTTSLSFAILFSLSLFAFWKRLSNDCCHLVFSSSVAKRSPNFNSLPLMFLSTKPTKNWIEYMDLFEQGNSATCSRC